MSNHATAISSHCCVPAHAGGLGRHARAPTRRLALYRCAVDRLTCSRPRSLRRRAQPIEGSHKRERAVLLFFRVYPLAIVNHNKGTRT